MVHPPGRGCAKINAFRYPWRHPPHHSYGEIDVRLNLGIARSEETSPTTAGRSITLDTATSAPPAEVRISMKHTRLRPPTENQGRILLSVARGVEVVQMHAKKTRHECQQHTYAPECIPEDDT